MDKKTVLELCDIVVNSDSKCEIRDAKMMLRDAIFEVTGKIDKLIHSIKTKFNFDIYDEYRLSTISDIQIDDTDSDNPMIYYVPEGLIPDGFPVPINHRIMKARWLYDTDNRLEEYKRFQIEAQYEHVQKSLELTNKKLAYYNSVLEKLETEKKSWNTQQTEK